MRYVVNFKKNHSADVPTLDKMICVLEESGINVLNVIITKYEIVRITEGMGSLPPDCAVAVEATLIVSCVDNYGIGDDKLAKFKLSNYFI
jgi:hypothetical protein